VIAFNQVTTSVNVVTGVCAS